MSKSKMVLLFLFLGTALGYGVYKLSESPPTWFDEGIYIQVSSALVRTGAQTIQTAPGVIVSTGHVTGGYPFLFPVGLAMQWFGDSLAVARAAMVGFILVLAFLSFLLVRSVAGENEALAAVALIVTFPSLYGYGKNVLGEVPGMVYAFLALFAIVSLERRRWRGTGWYMVAGMATGLTAATKPIFLLFPFALAVVALCRVREPVVRRGDVVVFIAAFSAPLLLWAHLQFGGQDVFSEIMSHYGNPYAEQSIAVIVLQNLRRFFTEMTPIATAICVGLWMVSWYLRQKRNERVFFAEEVALVFSLLVLAAYLRTPGWYRYFFEASVTALVFFPSSLRVALSELKQRWTTVLPQPLVVRGVLLVMILVQFYQLNTTSWVAAHYQSQNTSALEEFFSKIPPHATVFAFNTPQVIPFLTGDSYYQYIDINPTGSLAYGAENIPLLEAGVADIVVVGQGAILDSPQYFRAYDTTSPLAVGRVVVLNRKPK
jgi:4-amino-4-deoxy-L-arabinose transferase-like glycosyltransferase